MSRPTTQSLRAIALALLLPAVLAHAQGVPGSDAPVAEAPATASADVTTDAQLPADDAAEADAGAEAVRLALESAATHLAAGRASAALEALRPVEAVEPDNPWLWFYRGVAEYQLNEPYRAMDAFDRAAEILRELGDPDPDLAFKIRQHRREARLQTFRINLQTGIAYDTNVTFLGSGAVSPGQISGEPDGKFFTQAQIDYAPIANSREALAFGARVASTWNFSVEQFNFQDYGAYVRYTRRLDEHWQAAIQYDYDFMYLGNDPYLSHHAITPSLSYLWSSPPTAAFRPDTTKLSYRFQDQEFLFRTSRAFDQDNTGHGVGIEQTFKWRPIANVNWTWDLSVGYFFDSIFTDGSEFARREHNFFAGLAVPLIDPADPTKYLLIPDKELVFRFGAQWQIGRYRNRSIIDQDHDRRHDYITTLNFGLSQTLLKDVDYGDLVLHGLISWTDADSNSTVQSRNFPYRRSSSFTYDKVVYGLQLEWTW